MNASQALWTLANEVAIVATSGEQLPTLVRSVSSTHEPLAHRRVRVVQEDLVWEGPLRDWQGAVREAACREPGPGEVWTPGPYESAASE